MTETTTPPAPGPGLLARFVGILTSPRATFEKVVANPRALGAMALVALLSGGASGLFMSSAVGKAAFMEQALQRGGGATPGPEAQAAIEKFASYAGPAYFVTSFIFVPLSTVVMSAILYMIFNVIMGGTANFRQMMAVVAHSQFISALGAIFTFTLNYFRGTLTTATTLAVFAPMLEENSFLYRFLGSFELFACAWVLVLSIGLAVLYRKKTGSIATALFGLYGVIALVIAYFRSR